MVPSKEDVRKCSLLANFQILWVLLFGRATEAIACNNQSAPTPPERVPHSSCQSLGMALGVLHLSDIHISFQKFLLTLLDGANSIWNFQMIRNCVPKTVCWMGVDDPESENPANHCTSHPHCVLPTVFPTQKDIMNIRVLKELKILNIPIDAYWLSTVFFKDPPKLSSNTVSVVDSGWRIGANDEDLALDGSFHSTMGSCDPDWQGSHMSHAEFTSQMASWQISTKWSFRQTRSWHTFFEIAHIGFFPTRSNKSIWNVQVHFRYQHNRWTPRHTKAMPGHQWCWRRRNEPSSQPPAPNFGKRPVMKHDMHLKT